MSHPEMRPPSSSGRPGLCTTFTLAWKRPLGPRQSLFLPSFWVLGEVPADVDFRWNDAQNDSYRPACSGAAVFGEILPVCDVPLSLTQELSIAVTPQWVIRGERRQTPSPSDV